ncbi:hypothetical protein OM392_14640 [Serratia bockelmannii]|uniref:hypothetical protein n=1 Tax=Serratia bockelmannii TaxID=2703793 RepID=UPI00223E9D17|nr:hypothetical protein [Serratia bockelmannii]MCW7609113.1 hypothetical protein [Serratia bockelmannii]
MGIKKTMVVNTATIAYDFGVTISTSPVEVDIELEVVSCVVDGYEANARYSISINGVVSDVARTIKFKYSGGDINAEAEAALLAAESI